MEDRIDGAELCHRMDAAKQLEKHKSKAAARFLAKYRGVSCGHSIRGRPNPADPCSGEDAAGRQNAPAPFSEDLLTVLSAVDEDLMARLVRAQTADGSTVIEFLDDVMQDRNDGFKPHHRIAAAKELIVHIVRDEQPELTAVVPAPTTVVPAQSLPRTRYGTGTQGGGGGRSTTANSARTEPVLSTVEGSVHPEPRQIVVPAKSLPRTRYGAGTQGGGGGRSTAANPAHPEPAEGSQLETNNSKLETLPVRRPRTRRTRTQRRRDGAARAAIRRKALGSERIEEEKDEKPAPVELTIAERRIKERLEQHWHEPDPYGGPIDSTHPGRSPPW